MENKKSGHLIIINGYFLYCSSVERLLPMICCAEGEGFTNVLKLYISWNDKIEKQNALQQKNIAERKLKNECKFNFKALGT